MTSIEKKLRALANGKDLPWDQTKALLERLGAEVKPLLVVAVILKFVIQTGNL
ncbi:hypothetical protein [Phascolarctobacterium succinatutens]|uniref:hypothetical protein n=1 Tax=Phascolarctobacterium succinatutens TaxID=626940 RepID=UPI0026EF77AE|nr:hypothetical protein [Phascolarctobacterium succinatutens]